MRRYRAQRPEYVALDRERGRARNAALSRLVDEHRDRYEELYREELQAREIPIPRVYQPLEEAS